MGLLIGFHNFIGFSSKQFRKIYIPYMEFKKVYNVFFSLDRINLYVNNMDTIHLFLSMLSTYLSQDSLTLISLCFVTYFNVLLVCSKICRHSFYYLSVTGIPWH